MFSASAVFLFAAVYLSNAAEFQWVRNAVDYESAGRRLDGHVLFSYDNIFTVTQCASRCQLLGACASYNFLSTAHSCEVNSASHVTNPGDVIASEESYYYKRDAFTIDPVTNDICLFTHFSRHELNLTIVRWTAAEYGDTWPSFFAQCYLSV